MLSIRIIIDKAGMNLGRECVVQDLEGVGERWKGRYNQNSLFWGMQTSSRDLFLFKMCARVWRKCYWDYHSTPQKFEECEHNG